MKMDAVVATFRQYCDGAIQPALFKAILQSLQPAQLQDEDLDTLFQAWRKQAGTPEGDIQVEPFVRWLFEGADAGGSGGPGHNLDWEDIWNRFDSDRSGRLTREEFTSVLQSLNLTAKQVNDVLQSMDQDKDGGVRYEEWINWLMSKATAEQKALFATAAGYKDALKKIEEAESVEEIPKAFKARTEWMNQQVVKIVAGQGLGMSVKDMQTAAALLASKLWKAGPSEDGPDRFQEHPNPYCDCNGMPVASACFEISCALSLLDNPGRAAEVLAALGSRASELVDRVYVGDPAWGNRQFPETMVCTKKYGRTVRDIFDERILGQFSPASNQPGRCVSCREENWQRASGSLRAEQVESVSEEDWRGLPRGKSSLDFDADVRSRSGRGYPWLSEHLRWRPASGSWGAEDFGNLLLKVKAINEIGSLCDQMMRPHGGDVGLPVVAWMTGLTEEEVTARYRTNRQHVRVKDFDTVEQRGRVERAVTSEHFAHVNGGSASLGNKEMVRNKDGQFGDFFDVNESFEGLGSWEAKAKRASNKWRKKKGAGLYTAADVRESLLQALYMQDQERVKAGAPMKESQPSRPGLLSDEAVKKMPQEFGGLGLPRLLEGHSLRHGVGLNTWKLFGKYFQGSLREDLPFGGCHSGGSTDGLLGAAMLSEEDIHGRPEVVLPLGLAISAFMNFGGYHSFVETIPIFETYAEKGRRFKVSVAKGEGLALYPRYLELLRTFAPGAAEAASKFLETERTLRAKAAAEGKAPSETFRHMWDVPNEDDSDGD